MRSPIPTGIKIDASYGGYLLRTHAFRRIALVIAAVSSFSMVVFNSHAADETVTQTIDEDSAPRAFALTLYGADADGDTIKWRISEPAQHGKATVSGSGASKKVGYTPDDNWNGTDFFTVEASDGLGGISNIVVKVVVEPRNDAPINTLKPSLSGVPHVGQTVRAMNGEWTDDNDINPGRLTYRYQWQRAKTASGKGATDIPGANRRSYTITDADHDSFIGVKVTALDSGEGLPKTASTTAVSDFAHVGNSAPVISLTPIKPEPADEEIPDEPEETFMVAGFRFVGNDSVPTADLDRLLSPYVNQPCTLSTLAQAANYVTANYRQRGLVVAKAYLPAQEITDGIVEIMVVEGKIGKITVDGNTNYSENFVRRFITEAVSTPPISNDKLERGLLTLNEFEGLHVSSVLKRGTEPGTVDLQATVKDRFPLQTTLEYNNFGSEFVSRDRVSMKIDWTNALLDGAHLSLQGVVGDRPNDLAFGSASYVIPIGNRGTKVGITGSYGGFDVSQEFANLGLEGESASGGLYVSHPFAMSRQFRMRGEFGVQAKDARFFILDNAASADKVRVVYTELTSALNHWGGTSRSAFNVTQGLGNALGGLSDDDPDASRRDADNSFTRLSMSIARHQPLTEHWSISANASGQWTSDSLVASEEWQVGGANSVRGYAPGAGTGDNGYSGSLELRYTRRATVPWAVLAFVDHGYAQRRSTAIAESPDVEFTGAGLGLRLHYGRRYVDGDLRLDLGWPVSPSDNSIDDRPIVYVSTSLKF